MAEPKSEVLDSAGSAPEEDPVVELDESEEKEPALVFDENAPNLALEFANSEEGLEALKDYSKMVLEDFDDDWESCEEYRQQTADDLAVFCGVLPKKQYPFDRMANVNLPLMMENINRITTQFYSEIFGDWGRLFEVLPVGTDDYETADILTRHGNWQLGHDLPDFKRQQARGVNIFCIVGDVTGHSFYDHFREQNIHEILTKDEFVTPYSHVTTMPDYSDLPHVIKILRLYKHQVQRMRKDWLDVEAVLEQKAPSWSDDPESHLAETAHEVSGTEPTENERSNAYVFYQWEGWADLPGQEDQRYLQIIVEKTSRAVVSVKIMEEEDWQDRERYDRQMSELEMFTAATREYEAMAQAHASESQAHAEVGGEIGMVAMDPQHHAHLQAAHAAIAPPPLPPPPVMPDWMLQGAAAPAPVKRKPLYMFAHAVCIEPLAGNLGLSFGRMQAAHNRGVNTIMSQFVDAAALANVPGMIRAPGVKFKGGKPEWYPGASLELESMPAGGFANAFQLMQHGQANPQMMEIVSLMWDKSQSSIQSSPILSGEAGKSGETFRGVSTRLDQASKQLSVPASFYSDFVKQLIKNNAKLNAEFLPEEEILAINDDRLGELQQIKIGREMYRRNYQIKLSNDLTFASNAQRIATADEVAQMPTVYPPLQANPKFQYEALKRALEERGMHRMVVALGPPPPPQQIPFGTPPPMQQPPPGAEGEAPPPNGQ